MKHLQPNEILTSTIEILLPARCHICGRRVWQTPICQSCTPTLPDKIDRCPICYTPWSNNNTCLYCRLHPLPCIKMRFLWGYSGAARRLVNVMKYHPSPALCKVAGELLANALPSLELGSDFDLVVPIPSSRSNLILRGFNQCDILAEYVAAALEIDLDYLALRHTKKITPQASLSHNERLRNMKDTFAVSSKKIIGKRILIVDDVITTGATTNSAAQTLLRGGAAAVGILALIRSDNWLNFRDKLLSK